MFVKPSAEPPFRTLVLAACRDSWYEVSDEERRDVALPTLQHLLDDWEELGFGLLHSFDDDFFLVGQPGSLQFPIFILGEVPSLDTVVQTFNLIPAPLRSLVFGLIELQLAIKAFGILREILAQAAARHGAEHAHDYGEKR